MRFLLSFLVSTLLAPAPVAAQYSSPRCYQVAAYTAPNLLRCQQSGTDYLGRPIWTCC
jgi:hypothetical protein